MKTYKFRLYPGEEHKETLRENLELCRKVYNYFLERLNEADEVPNRTKLQSQLPQMKEEIQS